MRNLKKVLALVLALVMSMSLVTIANAADFTDDSEINYKEAVDVMSAIGVLNGLETGAFNPTGTLTREQAAKIICTMLLGENADKLGTQTSSFSDVAATRWSAPYIEYCNSLGIVTGNGNGTFNPTGKLTGHAFAKMLLVALGYDAAIQGYTGAGWSVNVAKDAVTAGIDVDGVLMSNYLTREQAAQMAFQTLEADMVRYSSKGTNITTGDGTTIVVGASDPIKENYSSALDYAGDATDNYLQFCEKYFEDLSKLAGTPDDLGRPSNYWTYDSDEIGTFAKAADDSIVINTSDAATISNVLTSSKYFNLKSSAIGTVTYYLNGDPKAAGTSLQAGDVVELFKTSGKVTTVAVTRYTLAKIDDVDTDVSAADAKNDISAYVSLVELDGSTAVGAGTYNDTAINGYNAATYAEDAYLAVALDSTNKIVASYVADTAEGVVTTYKSTEVTLGGTKYSISAAKDSDSVSSFNFDDTNYVAYLTKEGYVLGIDGTDAVKLDDVYYINGVYYTKAANGSATYYAQVVSMDGTVSEMQLEKYAFETTLTSFTSGAAVDTFKAVSGLYSFSDKDTNSTNSTKANNGKYSVAAYTTGDYEVNTGNTLSANVTSSSNSITLSGGTTTKFYINSNTKFIMVDWDAASANADITVTSYTGATRVASGKSVAVIGSESGSSYVANVVVVAGQNLTSGVTNTNDVVYLSAAATTEVKGGYESTVYFMDGSNKTVTIDAAHGEGFFTYAINSDGVYELSAIANPVYGAAASVTADFKYDDESGYIPDTTINSIYNSELITFTQITGINTSYKAIFSDVKLSANLQVVDARTSANSSVSAYTNKIDTLAKLEAAMKKGTVTATAYVDDGEVLLIAVTSMPDARSSVTTVASANAVKGSGASAGLTVTAAAVVDNGTSGYTIKVTASGAAEGDTIVVTAVPTDAAASASGAVTLTYSSSAWNTQTITITAENGATQAYTVSVQ